MSTRPGFLVIIEPDYGITAKADLQTGWNSEYKPVGFGQEQPGYLRPICERR